MSLPKLFIGHMFNFNLQFAEMPVDQTRLLVEQGHRPLLDLLERHPRLKADLFFTGVTDEYLRDHASDVIARVKAGLGRGQFGLGTYTYAHPVLSLIPFADVVEQILLGLEADEATWGIRPAGFLLPEVAWDVALPRAMELAGLKWVAIYKEIVPKYAEAPDFPGSVLVQGAGGATVPAVLGHRVLGKQIQAFLRGELGLPRLAKLIEELRQAGRPGRDQLLLVKQDAEVLYFTSIEYYREKGRLRWGDPLPEVEAADRLDELWSYLETLPEVEFTTIGSFLAGHPPAETVYAENISGHAGMDAWLRGEGRERLNVLTDAARQSLTAAEYALRLAERLGLATGEAKAVLREGRRQLMLAENSDGRAFVPHPTRKLAVATAALEATRLAGEALSLVPKRPTGEER
ncbi:MAG: hypothetical protein IMW99_02455 [Firmicutes bacterium]|nr:hypothetical protein [Bacillota bacterium]